MAYVKRCTKSGQLPAVWRNHEGRERQAIEVMKTPSAIKPPPGLSPIEMLIDAACQPPPVKFTDEQKAACAQLGRDVVSDLRQYHPERQRHAPVIHR